MEIKVTEIGKAIYKRFGFTETIKTEELKPFIEAILNDYGIDVIDDESFTAYLEDDALCIGHSSTANLDGYMDGDDGWYYKNYKLPLSTQYCELDCGIHVGRGRGGWGVRLGQNVIEVKSHEYWATRKAVIDFARKMHDMDIDWHPNDKISDYGGIIHRDVLTELESEWESLKIRCDVYAVDVYETTLNMKKP